MQGRALVRYYYKIDPDTLPDAEFMALLAELEWVKERENG